MVQIDESETGIPNLHWALKTVRGKILRALSGSVSPLSFKDVSARTGIAPSLTAYHLKLLADRGMVERTYSHISGRKDFSYYSLTPSGSKLLEIERVYSSEGGPLPSSLILISWRNMPRCFVTGGV